MSVKENLATVRQRITAAALSVGRDPREIKLVAAIKNIPTEMVLETLKNGLTDIGENKVQEARARHEEIKSKFPNITWHMIGHLQRNKVRHALDIFDIIQSVDSERLAQAISGQKPILIEVNTSEEESKYGIPADSVVGFVKKVSNFDNLKVQGLMTIAPLTDDQEKSRPYFKQLKSLSDNISSLNLQNVEMKYLSMGMTDDFEVAIEEGSTLVRIGRAIFGQRPPKLRTE